MDEPEHTAGGHRLSGRAVPVWVLHTEDRARGEIRLKHLLDLRMFHLFPNLAIILGTTHSLLFRRVW